MSYEPMLLIKHHLLRDALDNYNESGEYRDEDTTRVVRYLQRIIDENQVIDIDGILIVICTPEFTSFNALVRNQLQDWGVPFWSHH